MKRCEDEMKEILIDKTLTAITPEIVAELFWGMDSCDQAKFYNYLADISKDHITMQMQYITEEDGLTLDGRRVMQNIGEYSHWGVTCKIIKEAMK